MADIVRVRGEIERDRVAYTFLSYRSSDEPNAEDLTYGDLLKRAEAVAATLQQSCGRGDRVLIVCSAGLDYIAAFFGCQIAGLVAVPAYPPRNARHMGRLESIVDDAGAAAILARADLTGRLVDWAGGRCELPPIVAVDQIERAAGASFAPLAIRPDDLAFLQYTSGTTGRPKGVMVSHKQLLENTRRIITLHKLTSEETGVSWLPPYHDMGLVGGLVVPLAAGFPCFLMSPAAFLQRPARWLEALSEYRATITMAPNFAWQLCAGEVSDELVGGLDLSSLMHALSGAEPVRLATLEAFAARFAESGFRPERFVPVYGMAETVLLTTGTVRREPPRVLAVDRIALSEGRLEIVERTAAGSVRDSDADRSNETSRFVVSCGRVIDGHHLGIVEPETLRECPLGSIGEIWVSGWSVAAGYWNEPEQTEATFGARLADDREGGTWLRTGDLGALADGELYVLGRIKEMVIIRGRNHYAQDLEATAAASDPILGHDRTIAFGIEEDGEERVVLVHELTRTSMRALDVPSVASAMRQAVLEAHEIDLSAIVFVKPAHLPRTTSGKPQRGKARDLFLAGELEIVAHWRAAATHEGMADPAASRAVADKLIEWLRAYAPQHIDSFEIDERRTIPASVLSSMAKAGLFGLRAPVDLGGIGLTALDANRVVEQLAAIDLTLTLCVGNHNALGLQAILDAAPSALQKRLVPGLASGRSFVSFALTEPGAGSNPRALRTVARRDGAGGWRLSGQKSWIGLGAWADAVVVICRLHDEADDFLGFGAFVVERGAEGFQIGPEALTLGMRGFPQNTLIFEDVRLSDDAMLGLPGEGMAIAQRTLRLGRVSLAAVSLGGMKRCAQLMLRYAERRRIGTGLLLDNAVTRQRMGELIGRIAAVEALLAVSGRMLDHGRPLPADLYAVAKISAPEYLWQAADRLVQLLGGRGYEEPNEAARILRDARVFRIFEGPTETVGMYLGLRLLADRSDLIGFLSHELNADGLVERLDQCRERIVSLVPAPDDVRREAAALALAEMGTAAALLAITRHAGIEREDRECADHVERTLLADIDAAEAKALAACAWTPSQPSWLCNAIAGFGMAIGLVDRDTPHGYRETDVYLRPDPDAKLLGETQTGRALALLQSTPAHGSLEVEDEPKTSSVLVLVRDVLSELTGLPRKAIGLASDLHALGLDSLQVTRLVARLAETTGRTIEMETVFATPTVAGLLAALEGATADWTAARPIAVVDRSRLLPLSFQQERLWFLDRLHAQAGAAYHIEGAVRLSGQLDVPALSAALAAVVERHESLRTVFAQGEGRLVQVVRPAAESGFALVEDDVSSLDDVAVSARVSALLARPFDLAAGPLFRATILRLGPDVHVLVLGGHHSVLDGWSVALLLHELSAFYRARVQGTKVDLPSLSIQYADYAAWQREVLSGECLEAETGWWRNTLTGVPEAISLPFDRPRPALMDYRGGSIPVQLRSAVVAGLKAFAASEAATLFMILEAAFVALLYRLGGNRDLVVGTAVAGRPKVELEALVGFFVNPVALRHRVDGLMSFRDHLRASRDVMLSAFQHASVPFEAVVEAVHPVRSLGHAPLLQVMIVLQNQGGTSPAQTLALEGVEVTRFEEAQRTAKFELDLNLAETAEGLVGTLEFATQLFDRLTAERIVAMFGRVVEAVVASPEMRVGELPLLDAKERALVVSGFNDTAVEYPRDETVIDLFSAQAAERPEAVGVVDGDRQLSYGELDEGSNRLARYLIGLGVGPETVVGVCLERSAELIVALLAIWKAGGAYLPLDPDYPRERLGFMLADAGAKAVLTTSALAAILPVLAGVGIAADSREDSSETTSDGAAVAHGSQAITEATAGGLANHSAIVLDDPKTAAIIAATSSAAVKDAERKGPLLSDTLAYVIYTSGSTGTPKGVSGLHHNIVNLGLAYIEACSLSSISRGLQHAGQGWIAIFDELLPILMCGGSTHIHRQDGPFDGEKFWRAVVDAEIDYLVVLPQLAGLIADSSCLAGRQLVVTGSRPEPRDLEGVVQYGVVRNAYGSTETSSVALISQKAQTPSSLMVLRPFGDARVYVLDRQMELCPVGVSGELFVGDGVVTRGYLGRAGLTAEKFVADPFSNEPGARLFRTGDLARRREDGMLELLGRIDHQVKIRGMRVEPGEIEAALSECAGIAQAVVAARADAQGDIRLVAYVVPSEIPDSALDESLRIGKAELRAEPPSEVHIVALEGVLDLEAVRAALRRNLPGHMVPSGFVGLTRLPLTRTGKVDRNALPDVNASLRRAAYVAPQSETEALVAGVFADLLRVGQVGTHDDFFDLGGHSLLAIRLVARLEAETGKTLPVRTIFAAPTVAELAEVLERPGADGTASQPIKAVVRSKPLPVSAAQRRVLVVEKLTQGTQALNSSFVLRLAGRVDAVALGRAVSWLLERHEILRTRYRQDPDSAEFVAIIGAPDSVHLDVRVDCTASEIRDLAMREATALIDPFDGPVFHAVLFPVTPLEAFLSVRLHHIAIDQASVGVLWREFALAYTAFADGEQPLLAGPPVQYADFAAWEAAQRTPERLEALRRYWRGALAGAPVCLNLPFDRVRPAAQSDRGGQFVRHLPEAFRDAVVSLAGKCRVTPFVVLETGLAIACGMLAASRDVVIGTVSEGRHHPDLVDAVGLYVNTLPIRHAIDPAAAATDHLAAGRDRVLTALENDALSFDEIVAALDPLRRPSFDPLFQVFCQLRPGIGDRLAGLGNIAVEQVPVDDPGRASDLAIVFEETGRRLTASVSYSADLFDRETVETLVDLYFALVNRMAVTPEDSVSRLWEGAVSLVRSGASAEAVKRLIDDPPAATGVWHPLSRVQQDLWFAEQSAPIGSQLASLAVLHCPIGVDVGRLEAAVRGVVVQSQSAWLRLSEQGLQGTGLAPTTDISRVQLAPATAPSSGREAIFAWHRKLCERRDRRSSLALFTARDGSIVVAGHSPHLFVDGWGSVQTFRRICENYAVLGKEPEHRFTMDRMFLPVLEKDRLYRWSASYDEDMAFWRDRLHDADRCPPLIALLADRPYGTDHASEVRSDRRELTAPFVAAIGRAAAALALSTGDLLTGVTGLYLARIADQDEIVISVPFMNRSMQTLGIPGQFANVVPVRLSVPADKPVGESLAVAAQAFRAALQHGRVTFGEIIRSTGLDEHHGNVSVNTLFVRKGLSLGGQPAHLQWLTSQERGLSFLFTQFGRTAPVELEVRYNAAVFDAETAVQHGDRLIGFIERACDALSARLRDVPSIGARERALVVSGFNDTAAAYPRGKTVIDLFCAQAAERPEAVAVVDGDRQLSYRELDEGSNRLARYLIGLGVGPEAVVGVCLERSAELIVALLGIWKAGGAYLPLDPDYPRERLGFMLADAGANVVVSKAAILAVLPVASGPMDGTHGPNSARTTSPAIDCTVASFEPGADGDECLPRCSIVVLDDAETAALINGQSEALLADGDRIAPLGSDALAYVIYTSGSTGMPKGVPVAHRSLAGFLCVVRDDVGLGSDAVALSLAAIGFDVSMEDFCLPLIAGSKLVLADRRRLGEPGYMNEVVNAHDVTFIDTTPTVMRLLFGGGWRPSEGMKIICGAEVLTRDLVVELANAGVTAWNCYGPTECTVTAVSWPLSASEPVIPIGSPLANLQVYVANSRLEPQPVGIPGELLIGGVQVARGYLARPGLTAEKFIADPFSGEPGGRLFRTGDLARRRFDGTLEFLGRIDHQVKIRGMRVEPGEIEAALSACPGIAHAAVVARSDDQRDVRLIAYLVPDGIQDAAIAGSQEIAAPRHDDAQKGAVRVVSLEGVVDLETLRTELKRTLPAHMVPAGFVGLTRLPMTVSGKLDRRALPDVDVSVAQVGYVAPRNERERQLCELVRDVVAHDRSAITRVGVDDDFFRIGGHSILAAQLMARIQTTFGQDLPLRTIFEAPTVRGLAQALDQAGRHKSGNPRVSAARSQRRAPASFQQERAWRLHRSIALPQRLNLGSAFLIKGAIDPQILVRALETVVDRYPIFRTRIVDGPDGLHQEIEDAAPRTIVFEDWSMRREPQEHLVEEATAKADAMADRPFSLASEFPVRGAVIALSPTRHMMAFVTHMAAADVWSLSHILPDVLDRIISALIDQHTPNLVPLTLTYVDYAVWQRSEAVSTHLVRERAYWRQRLSGAPSPATPLPDRPRSPRRSGNGGRVTRWGLSSEEWLGVEHVARFHKTTAFVTLIAAVASAIHHRDRPAEVLIGAYHIEKPDPSLWPQFGPFGNILPIRVDCSHGSDARAAIEQVKDAVEAAFQHALLPYEAMFEREADSSLAGEERVRIVFYMHGYTDELPSRIGDLEVSRIDIGPPSAIFDVEIHVTPSPSGVKLDAVYALDRYDEATIQGFLSDIVAAVRDMAGSIRDEKAVRVQGACSAENLLVPFGALHRPPPDSNRPILFCFHGAVGDATIFAKLAAGIGDAAEVIGIRAPGLLTGEPYFVSLEEMIDTYTQTVVKRWSARPHVLLGWSMGAMVAHSVACRLMDAGCQAAGVIVIDQPFRNQPGGTEGASETSRGGAAVLLGAFRQAPPPGDALFSAGMDSSSIEDLFVEAVMKENLLNQRGRPDERGITRRLVKSYLHHLRLSQSWRAETAFSGPLLVIRGQDTRQQGHRPDLGWSTASPVIATHDVEAAHFRLFDQPAVELTAGAVRAWLMASIHQTSAESLLERPDPKRRAR